MADLRIFSYLPNPRIWKATIAGRLSGVDVELRSTKPKDLSGWLGDFDAYPLTDADRDLKKAYELKPTNPVYRQAMKDRGYLEEWRSIRLGNGGRRETVVG